MPKRYNNTLTDEEKPKKIAWNKGLTKETDERVRINVEKSLKTIRKQYQNGRTAWNKGLKGYRKGYKHKEESKRKTSEKLKGRDCWWIRGKTPSKETRQKIREKLIGNKNSEGKIGYWRGKKNPYTSGSNNHNWNGGKSHYRTIIKNLYSYREWRKKVFERDNYTCQICGKRGGNLHAHHIEAFAKNKNKWFSLENGLTLCKEDHLGVHRNV